MPRAFSHRSHHTAGGGLVRCSMNPSAAPCCAAPLAPACLSCPCSSTRPRPRFRTISRRLCCCLAAHPQPLAAHTLHRGTCRRHAALSLPRRLLHHLWDSPAPLLLLLLWLLLGRGGTLRLRLNLLLLCCCCRAPPPPAPGSCDESVEPAARASQLCCATGRLCCYPALGLACYCGEGRGGGSISCLMQAGRLWSSCRLGSRADGRMKCAGRLVARRGEGWVVKHGELEMPAEARRPCPAGGPAASMEATVSPPATSPACLILFPPAVRQSCHRASRPAASRSPSAACSRSCFAWDGGAC